MPTYQYTCTACGERIEIVQKFSDAPLAVCPACGGRVRKVFSPVGIVFKGSGFYRTDSRAGNGAGGRTGQHADGSAAKSSGEKSSGDATSAGDASRSTNGSSSTSGSTSSGASTGAKVA